MKEFLSLIQIFKAFSDGCTNKWQMVLEIVLHFITYMDPGSGHHSVHCDYPPFCSICSDTVRAVAVCSIVRTIEACFGQSMVVLNCEVILACHRKMAVAFSSAWMIVVICSKEKGYIYIYTRVTQVLSQFQIKVVYIINKWCWNTCILATSNYHEE